MPLTCLDASEAQGYRRFYLDASADLLIALDALYLRTAYVEERCYVFGWALALALYSDTLAYTQLGTRCPVVATGFSSSATACSSALYTLKHLA